MSTDLWPSLAALPEQLFEIPPAPRPQALVLAAGYGTRMGERTRTQAKPTLSVAGQPLIHRTINWLFWNGFNRFRVNTHHCPESVVTTLERYMPNDALTLTVTFERVLRGSAGAVRDAFNDRSEPLLVVNGDTLADCDLDGLFYASRRPDHLGNLPFVTVGVVPYTSQVHHQVGFFLADREGAVQAFHEKPTWNPRQRVTVPEHSWWVNAGIYLIDPAVQDWIPAGGPYDLGSQLLPRLVQEAPERIRAVPLSGYCRDLGTPEAFEEGAKAIRRGHCREYPAPRPWPVLSFPLSDQPTGRRNR